MSQPPLRLYSYPACGTCRKALQWLAQQGFSVQAGSLELVDLTRTPPSPAELRQAMARHGIDALPLYPEGRPCSRPTTARVIEAFEPIQRHLLTVGDNEPQCLVTELTALQTQIIQLLGLSPTDYGR